MTQATTVRDLRAYPEPSEVKRLIETATNPRDKAFASLLARTGIRVSEAIHLKVSDIASVRIVGKR